MVTAALIDGGMPAIEKSSIIAPSTAPTPPGSRGIIPIKAAITKITVINSRETGYLKAKNMMKSRMISTNQIKNDDGRA